MSSLSLLVLPLLLTLPGDIETPAHAPHAASASPQEKPASFQHTPSTLGLEVGDWRNTRSLSMQRSLGFIHTHSAQLSAPHLLHLSLLASYSNTKKFPAFPGSDTQYSDVSRWMGVFSAAYVFAPWLEAYASYEGSSSFARRIFLSGQSSDDAALSASVSGQILGDTNLGLKVAHNFVPSFYVGLDLGMRIFNVGHSMSNVRFAFRPSLPLTWNLQEFSPHLPLALHANLGLHVGRDTGFLSTDAAKAMWQTFSWNLNSRHYGFFSVALEAPLPCATPFVEYQISFPFWDKTDNSQTPPLAKAFPQSLIVGAKLTLLPYVSFTLGGDFNLKSPQIPGIVYQPPWRFFMGVSFATALSSSPPPSAPPASFALTREETPPPVLQPQLGLVLKQDNKLLSGKVYVRGPNPQSFDISAHAPSTFHIPEGPQLLEILPDEGFARVKKVNVATGQKQTLTLDIESAPAEIPVRLVNQRILFAEPLAFTPNKPAELSNYGQTQLRALVDLLLRNHIRKIRVESHVELQKTGTPAMQLSAQRSQTVVDALAKLGVEPERIEVLNWGDSKPVAPNTVRKGRLLNRRMDFVVLERWE